MKQRNQKQRKVIPFPKQCPAYPNAADRKYLIDRLIDYALTLTTATGIVSIIFFMILV